MVRAYGSLTILDLLDTATYIYYADDAEGKNPSASPEGKKYIGIYSGPPVEGGQPNTPPAGTEWTKYVGARGTSTIKVTSSLTSYTTITNGITPAYRKKLVDVKSESKVEEVLVGDIIEYSYYHYAVLYVDDAYVYCGSASSFRGSKGATGSAGRGIDHTVIEYGVSENGEDHSTVDWKDKIPTLHQGEYLWIRTTTHYTDGDSEESYSVSYSGIDANTYYIETNQEEILRFVNSDNSYSYSPERLTFKIFNNPKQPDDDTNNAQISLTKDNYQLEIIGEADPINKDKGYLRLGFQINAENTEEIGDPKTVYFNIKEYLETKEETKSSLIFRFSYILNNKVAAIKIIEMRNGVTDDMAKFSVHANRITAAIQSTKLDFSSEGLTILNGGINIVNKENESVFSGDTDGNLTLKGTIYANNGEFRGKINADSGTIGGLTISEDAIYSGQNSTDSPLKINGNGSIYAQNITLGDQALIENQISLGRAYIKNPNNHEGIFLQAGKISLSEDGLLNLGGIRAFGGVDVGKNILNLTDFAISSITGVEPTFSQNEITLTTTTTDSSFRQIVFTIPNLDELKDKTLTISCGKWENSFESANQAVHVIQYYNDGTNTHHSIYLNKNTYNTFTVQENATNLALVFRVDQDRKEPMGTIAKWSEIQLEVNEEPTVYEPYIQPQLPYITAGDSNSSAYWEIKGDGTARFREIIADKATIQNSIMEIGKIQAVGSIVFFKDSWKVTKVSGKTCEIEVNLFDESNTPIVPLEEEDFIVVNGNEYYKIEEINGNQLTFEKECSFNIGDIITKIGNNEDYLITIQGDSNRDVAYSTKNSLTMSSIEIPENSLLPNFTKKIVLGDLTSIDSNYKTGLYAENVYLKGTLTTEAGETYAGVNTLTGATANKFGEEDKTKIIFWAGSSDKTETSIQQAPFQVTEAGSIYANKGIFEGSLISKSTIKGASIHTAKIFGEVEEEGKYTSAPLQIYNTDKGIQFFEFIHKETEDEDFDSKKEYYEYNNEKYMQTEDTSFQQGKRYYERTEKGTLEIQSSGIVSEGKTFINLLNEISYFGNSAKISNDNSALFLKPDFIGFVNGDELDSPNWKINFNDGFGFGKKDGENNGNFIFEIKSDLVKSTQKVNFEQGVVFGVSSDSGTLEYQKTAQGYNLYVR